jgi:hypothetical protein
MIAILTNPKFFPTVLIALDLCAAGSYALAHDTRRIIYWIAAAVLTATITY